MLGKLLWRTQVRTTIRKLDVAIRKACDILPKRWRPPSMPLQTRTLAILDNLPRPPEIFQINQIAAVNLFQLTEKDGRIRVEEMSADTRLLEVEVKQDGSVSIHREFQSGSVFNPKVEFEYGLSSRTPSKKIDDQFATLSGGISRVEIKLTFVDIGINVDVDRDGRVDVGSDKRHSWKWGSGGHGAILLVNNDRDVSSSQFGWRDRRDDRRNGPMDIQDLTPLSVDVAGPAQLPPGYELRLSVTEAAAAKIRIFSLVPGEVRQLVGPGEQRHAISYRVGSQAFGVEGLQYPDYGFSGLITITLLLSYAGTPVASDEIVLRVAPWIATNPILEPRRLYVCVEEGNDDFRADLKAVAEKVGVELVEVPKILNRGDRWIQDEIEIGYSSSPLKTFPVVLDGPRNRGLDDVPEQMLLGPDFGWVTRGDPGIRPQSMDSFGNLDCTPPLPGFPLGRVVVGTSGPSNDTRHMMKVVTDFLWAQQVQRPIELYSSWLMVGHIDEFMSFIPADNELGFKVALSSPSLAYRICQGLIDSGSGEARMLVGRWDDAPGRGNSLESTVLDFLNNTDLKKSNAVYQKHIDWNRALLKKEIGVSEADIVELPVVYTPTLDGADAFTGNMSNMVVLGRTIVIPKPFGPVVDNRCVFEKEASTKLDALGLGAHFIDTWYSYHVMKGGVHCGTNVLRAPNSARWWEYDPEPVAIA